MSWLFKLLGSTSGNVAEVDANSNAKINPPVTMTQSGYVALAARMDAGLITGEPLVKRINTSQAWRISTGQDNLFLRDTFNVAAVNSSNYRTPVTTQTVTFTNGYVSLNGSSLTSINTNSAIATYRYFVLPGMAELRMEMEGYRNTAPQANETLEFGLMAATLPGAAVPIDGIFFRFNTSAELRGVMSANGTETQTSAITAPSINVNHKWVIITTEKWCEFWIDDVLHATINVLTAAPAQGNPFMGGAVPWTARYYIGAAGPTNATVMRISDLCVTQLDTNIAKPWGESLCSMGQMAYQGQNGGTMGTSATYGNSINPSGVVPTNTTAALGSGLGGQFFEIDTLAVNTDGIIQSFQNPAGSVFQQQRQLIIRGVDISTVVTTIHSGGGYTAHWSLAFGHTSVSLATTEASATSAKAPRRVALGHMTFTPGSVVFTNPQVVSRRFDGGPIVVNPGEFVQCVKKKVGTAPTGGVCAHQVTFDAYFE